MRIHSIRVRRETGKQLERAARLSDVHVPAVGGGATDAPGRLE